MLVLDVRIKAKLSGNISGYRITNGENVTVNPIKSYKEIPDIILNKAKVEKELEEVIKGSDIVIARMPSILGLTACKICEKLNKRYLVEMVACAWDNYINHTNPIGKIIAPFMYIETKKCLKNAPEVLYVTNEFLQRRYPSFKKQIACSDVILEKIDDNILNERIDKIKNSNENIIKLCTVANVGLKYKGQKYVIKAISKLNSRENRKYKYYLVGNGNEIALKRLAKKYKVEEDCIFVGSKAHLEVFEILKDIDIYVQPSLQEGLPRALLEAMSVACPAIRF